MTITAENMIAYLQSMMDDYKKTVERYGVDDVMVDAKCDAMIACKEMVETLIQMPVNLQKNGKVTIGF